MTSTMPIEERIQQKVGPAARRFGYVLAAIINAVLLWVSHQLLDWEWPAFLTPEFDDLLPIITVSFVASIVANLVYVRNDAPTIKSIGNLVTAVIGFIGAVWTYRVFPFDFSDYDTNWSWLARTFVILGIVGTALGGLTEFVRLLTGRTRDTSEPDDG